MKWHSHLSNLHGCQVGIIYGRKLEVFQDVGGGSSDMMFIPTLIKIHQLFARTYKHNDKIRKIGYTFCLLQTEEHCILLCCASIRYSGDCLHPQG
jgi:hypothetical protein